MTFTRHFLIIFITISLFVLTFFETQGGYLFFAQAFPIVLILTCVVFIEELFKPTKKKNYSDDIQRQNDALGMKGLFETVAMFIILFIITAVFIRSNALLLKSLAFLLIFVAIYFIYKIFQKYTYQHMTFSLQRRITPINLVLVILFSMTFGMFYFKTIYLPKSSDLLVNKSEYQSLTRTAMTYSKIDSILALTKGKADTEESLDTLEILYTAYIEKIGGAKITRDNVLEYAILDWEDEACETAYRKLITPEYSASLEERTLTIKFNAFFYGLSGNIYRDLEHYNGQFDHLVYDLSDCSGGDIQQALYATNPIFPIEIVARIYTNENRPLVNTLTFSSSDYTLDADISIVISDKTAGLGKWASDNAAVFGYNIIGHTDNNDQTIYEMIYVKEINQFYAFPIGKLTGVKPVN